MTYRTFLVKENQSLDSTLIVTALSND